MDTEKLLKNYKTSGNLEALQEKVLARFQKQKLVFGNKFSIMQKNLVEKIQEILENPENMEACEFCGDVIFSGNLENIENQKICETCACENYETCACCGDYVYRESVHIFQEELFCKTCYFTEKENAINSHDIKNKKILALKRLFRIKKIPCNYETMQKIEFYISAFSNEAKTYSFSIEKYAKNNFRFGSWQANFWIDLTNKQENILKAIDFLTAESLGKIQKVYIEA